ncbi:MAG: hypothetical protein OER04_15810, partial [Cyclobacteriaceae bacterium]|nr:hypothetical protein [Cyclobacteriaceae bacterium]
MKTLLTLPLVLAITIMGCQSPESSTTQEQESVIHDGIRWEGEDDVANHMALRGLEHFMNIEFAPAYTMSEAAVHRDSSLFASHTLLAILSRGDKREHHTQMAKKYVENENETCKLFVSLLDVEDDTTGVQRRAIWTQMRELSNGPFIHYMYARNMDLEADTAAVLAELDKVIEFCHENDFSSVEGAAYNIKGYLLNMTGDLEAGTAAIDTYLDLYPQGYNPIDSRAEFYL